MLKMPPADGRVLARRAEIARALAVITPDGVIEDRDALRVYESDGLTAYRQPPMLAVLPRTTEQVSKILAWCHRQGVKVVPRGSGTSLSGGALPLEDAVLVGMARFNRVLEIDYADRVAVVQPGVTNLAVTQAVEAEGFYYAPDPSSQIACSIGGNVAENSGGVHCLKYGLTTNNVLGVEMVLMDGQVVRLGGRTLDAPGLDLLGLVVGSEGLLGVVTEVTVRILPRPETARAVLIGFPSVEQAGQAVADVIAAGIIPAGMEMMDKPAIHAAEAFVGAGYPLDVEALLIGELDGPGAECDHLIGEVEAIARRNGATTCRVSTSEEERLAFWAGRKAAFPAVGRISPDYYCMDGTIPRRRLPEVLRRMDDPVRHPRAESRECVPRRRRQPAPPDPLRRQPRGRAGAGRGLRRRHPAPVRGGGRGADRRARGGGGEARPDAGDVHGDRSGAPAAGEVRLRPRSAAQPRQGVPGAAPLRRARPHARARRPDRLPRPAAVLMRPTTTDELAQIVADAAASGRKLEIAGGGTKAEVGAPRDAERLDMTGIRLGESTTTRPNWC